MNDLRRINYKSILKILFIWISVLLFIYFFCLQVPSVISIRYLLYSTIIGLASGILYFVLYRLASKDQTLPKPGKSDALKLLLGAAAYTIVYILLFGLPNTYLLAPRIEVRVEVPAVEEGGANLKLSGISNGMRDVSYKELKLSNAQISKDGVVLVPAAGTPAVVTWQGNAWGQVRLEFAAEQAGIPIQLALNGKREVLDSQSGIFDTYLKLADFGRIKFLSTLIACVVLVGFFTSMLIFLELLMKLEPVRGFSARVKQSMHTFEHKQYSIVFWVILAIGIFVRVYKFGEIPGGLHVDEAMAGYQAWSLLNYGVDHFGNRFPVYFVAVGGGMNALEIYLMMPFIFLIGLNSFAIRLPQLILSVCTLALFYQTVEYFRGKNAALIALSILVINPWHIMMSRWGLESNLLPFFLLLLTYFLSRSISDIRFFVPACITAGIGMYAYALGWIPILVLLSAYFIRGYIKHKLTFLKANLLGLFCFLILALPLFLFLLVNIGTISEIRDFISIPKLTVFRGDELASTTWLSNLQEFLGILTRQTDGLPWNSIRDFGIFYKFGLVFIAAGFIITVKRAHDVWHLRGQVKESVIITWTIIALVIPLITKVNIIRANSLWLPLIYYCAIGVYEIFNNRNFHVQIAIIVLFCITFFQFCLFYFSTYPSTINEIFAKSVDLALKQAQELTLDKIILSEEVYYARVMFYDKIPPLEFKDSVVYETMNTKYLKPLKFGRYINGLPDGDYPKDMVYVVKNDELNAFEEQGFEVIPFEYYSAVYYPKQ